MKIQHKRLSSTRHAVEVHDKKREKTIYTKLVFYSFTIYAERVLTLILSVWCFVSAASSRYRLKKRFSARYAMLGSNITLKKKGIRDALILMEK